MLLRVIFIQYITVALAADYDFVQKYKYNTPYIFQENLSNEFSLRTARDTKEKMAPEAPSCEYMKLTQSSPFIALMLFKTSGRFLGMGSIIDRETIITAEIVVRNTLETPHYLLALAGRLNPWWGDNSQVYPAKYIYVHDYGIAIVRLTEALDFNKHVQAIRLLKKNPDDYAKDFTIHWGIFGIPRSTWNIQGDKIERSSIYVMKVETILVKPDEVKKCGASYPGLELNDTVHTCTMANYTFGWGCQGSPALAVDKKGKLHQIAVVIEATHTAVEQYHVLLKIGFFLKWIRAHSLIGFNEEDEDD